MGMGMRVGRVRWMRVVVGRVGQGWMVVSVTSPLSSPSCRCSVCPLGHASLSSQAGLLCGGPVGLRDDDVGVLKEGSGAEAVVVH